jgi:hypothetical protein
MMNLWTYMFLDVIKGRGILMYDFILNPKTKKRVSIFSKSGQNILNEVFRLNTDFKILDIVHTNTLPVLLRYCNKSYYPYNTYPQCYHSKKRDVKLFGEI